MGALKGSISYARFRVRGELPEGFRERFVERLRLRAFRPLVAAEDDEVRDGWCSIESPLDLELDHAKVFWSSYVNLGYRVDRWQIPAPLFQAHFGEAEREHLQKRGRERLGKREKEELTTTVKRRLRAQLLPVMKVIDLSWNLETGVVRFWSQSPRVHEGLGELFEDTFQMSLVPDSPGTSAQDLGLSPAQEALFAMLKPTAFHAQP